MCIRDRYFIVRVLSACCVICALPHLGILSFFIRLVFFFCSSFFSGGVFLLCSRTRYASTWFAYLDSLATFSFSLTVWPQNLYLSRIKNQEGHWGYRWCRWVEKTVSCENNNNNNIVDPRRNFSCTRYVWIQHRLCHKKADILLSCWPTTAVGLILTLRKGFFHTKISINNRSRLSYIRPRKKKKIGSSFKFLVRSEAPYQGSSSVSIVY